MPTIHPVVDEGLGNSAYVVELGDGGRWSSIRPATQPRTLSWPAGGGSRSPTAWRPTCMPTS